MHRQPARASPRPPTCIPGPDSGCGSTSSVPRPRPSPASGEFETPAISDLLNRLYTMQTAISNLTDEHLTLFGTGLHGEDLSRATT